MKLIINFLLSHKLIHPIIRIVLADQDMVAASAQLVSEFDEVEEKVMVNE